MSEISSEKLAFIAHTFRQHREKLPHLPVSYTALFRTREQIEISDNLLWGGVLTETVASLTSGRPWREKTQRAREVLGGDSPETPK